MKKLYSISPALLWMAAGLVLVTGTTPVSRQKAAERERARAAIERQSHAIQVLLAPIRLMQAIPGDRVIGMSLPPGSDGQVGPRSGGTTGGDSQTSGAPETTGSTATTTTGTTAQQTSGMLDTTGTDATSSSTTSDGETTSTSGFPWTTGSTATTSTTSTATTSTATTTFTTGSSSTGYTGSTTATVETPEATYVELPGSTFNYEVVGEQINDGGRVVGNRWSGTHPHVFIWDNPTSSYLSVGMPTNVATDTRGLSINNSGTACGWYWGAAGYGPYPVFFDPGLNGYTYTIPAMPGQFKALERMSSAGYALGAGINGNGYYTSAMWVNRPDQPNYNHIVGVPPWPGDSTWHGIDMNNSGHVLAGSMNLSTNVGHMYVARDYATVIGLPTYAGTPGQIQNWYGINDEYPEQVMAVARDYTYSEWVVTCPPGTNSTFLTYPQPITASIRPYDINTQRQICGSYGTQNGNHPFVISYGHFFDLAPLFANDQGGGVLEVHDAVSLNENNQVLVTGTRWFFNGSSGAGYRTTFIVTWIDP